MKLYIVDAFSEQAFGGNQAGVVIVPSDQDFPDDETMRKVDAELKYSETAFVKRLNDKEFRTRYFTPASEVDLCGHATVGTFYALLYAGIIEEGKTYINHTLAGDLEIDVKDGKVLMDMATPELISEITEDKDNEVLYKIMGIDYQEQKAKGLPGIPQLISTGLPDIIMPVATLADLEAINPDFPALSKLSEDYKVVGVHAFTVDGDDATCHARNFAPLYDIDEEAATGTSSGALTYYGYLNNFAKSGDDLKFIQGEKMGRPSAIETHIEVEGEKVKIKVGGSAAVLIEGEINI